MGRALTKRGEMLPSVFDEFFRPWNDFFGNERTMTVPAVNVAENKDDYQISVAAPGLKKSDFNIDVEGNMLRISCEKEENREEKEGRYSRTEYNYSCFNRTFTLPEVLRLTLPKTEQAKKAPLSKHISIK